MAECKYYSWNRGDNNCSKLDRKVKTTVVENYCNSWNYLECPVYNSYNEGYDLRSEYEEYINDDNSGCYLTSACIAARGLPDDCEELMTLRIFRDKWLKLQPGGIEEIAEYYSTAPLL